METGLEEAGLRVTRLRASDTYARLLVESDTDATYVDLATDYRLMPALETAEGLILAGRELAADKTLALARDGTTGIEAAPNRGPRSLGTPGLDRETPSESVV